jgi:hypothetical protein
LPYAFETSSTTATWSPERGGFRKSNFTGLALLRQLDPFDLLERLDAALDLRGFGGMRREALDEALLLGQHRLLTSVGGLTVGLADRPLRS